MVKFGAFYCGLILLLVCCSVCYSFVSQLRATIFSASRQQPHMLIPPPFSYSEMSFRLSPLDKARLLDIMTLDVMRRSLIWNGTSCSGQSLGLAFCGVVQRLARRKCLNIFVFGGSTSMGANGNSRSSADKTEPKGIWFVQFETWLNSRFPCENASHRVTAVAGSGHGSQIHLALVPTYFPKMSTVGKIDLIMLEVGTNDLTSEIALALEPLVLSLLAFDPTLAFLIISTSAPLDFQGTVTTRYDDLVEAKHHFPLCQHMHMPLVSIPHAMLTTLTQPGNVSSNIYTIAASNESSPLYIGGPDLSKCTNRSCMLYLDGNHLTRSGHTLLASALAMLFIDAISQVQTLASGELHAVNVSELESRAIFRTTHNLTQLRTPLYLQSFRAETLPEGFVPPYGWSLVNERNRFGLAAFTNCSSPRLEKIEVDQCADAVDVAVGGATVFISLLRSYKSMGMLMIEAPPSFLFTVCEFPLPKPISRCFIDGIFGTTFPWRVSLPSHVRLVLTTETGKKMVFPQILRLHIASTAEVIRQTVPRYFHNPKNTSVPDREDGKIKVLGWYSLSDTL